jgi:glucose/arabinose dehydrogenase
MKKLTIIVLIAFMSCKQHSQTPILNLQNFGTGFSSPVDIANCGDNRLFIVEQDGIIKILNSNGTTNATPFLNITALTNQNGEQGLLGMTFHPNYTSNGFFFVNYTNTSGNTVIARYSVSANPNVANTTATILLTVNQPFSNHNGGTIKFGPDGYLYIGMGDGGSGGDPGNRAQNINDNLGKMLRIDVNSGSPYGIPAGNPYVGVAGNDEIWAIGLRNPWKFSFDSLTGDLLIADVGQGTYEEVNKVSATLAGVNYGWRCFEGNSVYNNTGNCATITGTTAPLLVVNHNIGSCSITGGFVYRGTTYPNLIGKYLFTDYCNPKIGVVNTTTGAVAYTADFVGNFVSFGEDNVGELYVSDINGTIYKIMDTSLSVSNFAKDEFKIYPNPAKNELYLEKASNSYPVEAEIYDLNGKQIIKQKMENVQRNTINTNGLVSGLYLLKLKNNLEIIVTQKLLIE